MRFRLQWSGCLFLGLMISSAEGSAFSSYPAYLPNANQTGGNGCITCHYNFGGGGARNPFGVAWRQARNNSYNKEISDYDYTAVWTELYHVDTDGDGQTNGEELGDPCGQWTYEGGTAGRSTDIGRPGDASVRASDPGAPDQDCDTRLDNDDNCPLIANTDQANRDGDAAGDVCDCEPNDGDVYQLLTGYPDGDGDGVAPTSSNAESICSGGALPLGYTATAGADCDDTDPNVWLLQNLYRDTDGDGYAQAQTQETLCTNDSIPYGYRLNSSGIDCDDNNNTIYRLLNGYADGDGDGVAPSTSVVQTVCIGEALPPGYAAVAGTDCDDQNADIWLVRNLYRDTDGDGYARAQTQETLCTNDDIPYGYGLNSSGVDCDDNNNTIYRLLNGYADGDGDGVAPSTSVVQTVCSGATLPPGYAPNAGNDCNDSDSSIWQTLDFYQDQDNDGKAKDNQTVALCVGNATPTGYSATPGDDCDDNNPDVSIELYAFADADEDGWTSEFTVDVCTNGNLPAGYTFSSFGIDCDDAVASQYKVWEVYLDEDGDDVAKAGATVTNICGTEIFPTGYTALPGQDCDDQNSSAYLLLTGYTDNDQDGIASSDAVAQELCTAGTLPVGYTSSAGTDCDDGDASVFAAVVGYKDVDLDGIAGTSVSETLCTVGELPDGYVLQPGADNCPVVANPQQVDSDGDGYGDACDCAPTDNTRNIEKNQGYWDLDDDGVAESATLIPVCTEALPALMVSVPGNDNCPQTPNANQLDVDGDGVGDACDNCIDIQNFDQIDLNQNGVGDVCETVVIDDSSVLIQTDTEVGNACDVEGNGGTRILVGRDDGDGDELADDGILSPGEIDSTAVLCAGADGVSASTQLMLLDENVGSECDDKGGSGTRIQSGHDDGAGSATANDGILDADEVDAVAYICHGAKGLDGSDGLDGTNGADGTNGTNGADGADGIDGIPSLLVMDGNVGDLCDAFGNGGTRIRVGQDDGEGNGTARDGTLDHDEVDSTSYVCNGATGNDGADGADGDAGAAGISNLILMDEEVGTFCGESENRGIRIRSGLDDGDGDGQAGDFVLHDDEVDSTSYLCHGAAGPNGISVLLTVDQSVGSLCDDFGNGGIHIRSGMDDGEGEGEPNDGLLHDDEVDATTYLCHGADGADGISSLLVKDANVGDFCDAFGNGGTRIRVGQDDGEGNGTARDGTLDDDEVDSTSYVCNGADGDAGAGLSNLILMDEEVGTFCGESENRGIRIRSGLDDGDGDGQAGDFVLHDDEVDSTSYLCHGAAGPNGISVLLTVDQSVGSLCDDFGNGGIRIRSGMDDGEGEGEPNDGLLHDNEVDATTYLCHGADGADGETGQQGLPGRDGTSCSVASDAQGGHLISCEDGTQTQVQDGVSCTIVEVVDDVDAPGGDAGVEATEAIDAGDSDGGISDGGISDGGISDGGGNTPNVSRWIRCDDGTETEIRDGTSCTVEEREDGSRVISCEDGTSVTVPSGQDGQDGQDGADGADGQDGADGTDGEDGQDGEKGSSCTVVDNENGTKTIRCDDGSEVLVLDGQQGPPGASCQGISGASMTILSWLGMFAFVTGRRRKRG